MQVVRTIDHTLYPRKALADARQAYREYCSLTITPVNGGKLQVTITVKDDYQDNARHVILEFLNYALDRSVQIHLEEA
jgi:hypothetical protein